MSAVTTRRVFRPKWWAILLTIIFVAITIRLGNWQGERARYKIDQQTQLDTALKAPTVDAASLAVTRESVVDLRYRRLSVTGSFDAKHVYFLDNKIQDGKAGYGVLQLFTFASSGRRVFVERGWIAADGDRSKLPNLVTPGAVVTVSGRINLPISRNPGTIDNDFSLLSGASGARINYVSLEELNKRVGAAIEPYVLEQQAGEGFIAGTLRSLPASGHQKNLAYQVQWYAFAALACVLFVFFGFRKQPIHAAETK